MHVCMYACMHVCMYVCMYACMHVCMYGCMDVWMYGCTYVRMYVCTGMVWHGMVWYGMCLCICVSVIIIIHTSSIIPFGRLSCHTSTTTRCSDAGAASLHCKGCSGKMFPWLDVWWWTPTAMRQEPKPCPQSQGQGFGAWSDGTLFAASSGCGHPPGHGGEPHQGGHLSPGSARARVPTSSNWHLGLLIMSSCVINELTIRAWWTQWEMPIICNYLFLVYISPRCQTWWLNSVWKTLDSSCLCLLIPNYTLRNIYIPLIHPSQFLITNVHTDPMTEWSNICCLVQSTFLSISSCYIFMAFPEGKNSCRSHNGRISGCLRFRSENMGNLMVFKANCTLR